MCVCVCVSLSLTHTHTHTNKCTHTHTTASHTEKKHLFPIPVVCYAIDYVIIGIPEQMSSTFMLPIKTTTQQTECMKIEGSEQREQGQKTENDRQVQRETQKKAQVTFISIQEGDVLSCCLIDSHGTAMAEG